MPESFKKEVSERIGKTLSRAYGVTLGRYLSQLRMREAKRLLAHGVSVTEVYDSRLCQPGHFSHRFARETSLSPREFQRQMRVFGAAPARLVASYIPT